MFNRYMSEDREAFEDLYRPVEEENIPEEITTHNEDAAQQPLAVGGEIKNSSAERKNSSTAKTGSGFLDLKRLLKNFNIGDIGILPLLLLAFLILDVDNDEKLLIVALAIVLGI